jgi:hypothetical protein
VQTQQDRLFTKGTSQLDSERDKTSGHFANFFNGGSPNTGTAEKARNSNLSNTGSFTIKQLNPPLLKHPSNPTANQPLQAPYHNNSLNKSLGPAGMKMAHQKVNPIEIKPSVLINEP